MARQERLILRLYFIIAVIRVSTFLFGNATGIMLRLSLVLEFAAYVSLFINLYAAAVTPIPFAAFMPFVGVVLGVGLTSLFFGDSFFASHVTPPQFVATAGLALALLGYLLCLFCIWQMWFPTPRFVRYALLLSLQVLLLFFIIDFSPLLLSAYCGADSVLAAPQFGIFLARRAAPGVTYLKLSFVGLNLGPRRIANFGVLFVIFFYTGLHESPVEPSAPLQLPREALCTKKTS